MVDGRGRYPRGLLENAAAPRELAEVRESILARGRAIIAEHPPAPPRFTLIEGTLSPAELDQFRALVVDGFTPAEALATIRPPKVEGWRWWRDPIVIGFAAGFVVIGLGLVWLAGS